MPEMLSSLTRARRAALTGDSFATTLLAVLLDTYGTRPLWDPDNEAPWSPETILAELQDDFDVVLPSPNFNRLMAGIGLLVCDDFYHSLPDFIWYCNVLSGDTFIPALWDPAEAVEVAWGITEGMLLQPPDDEDGNTEEPFSAQICAYIGKVLDREGIMTPPDVLRIAVRADDLAARANDFSDDPALFGAIHGFEAAKTEAINKVLKENLATLAKQLDALELRNGDTSEVVANMLRSLGK